MMPTLTLVLCLGVVALLGAVVGSLLGVDRLIAAGFWLLVLLAVLLNVISTVDLGLEILGGKYG